MQRNVVHYVIFATAAESIRVQLSSLPRASTAKLVRRETRSCVATCVESGCFQTTFQTINGIEVETLTFGATSAIRARNALKKVGQRTSIRQQAFAGHVSRHRRYADATDAKRIK